MAVGEEAKTKLINKIIEALGDSYIGCVDKKYYFISYENGSEKQVAISLTCPKAPVAVSAKPVVRSGGIDFEAEPVLVAPANVEVSEEERQTVADMMRRLGL